MNSNTINCTTNYSLDSKSRRWWWPSATAGGVGVAAIAAIVVLPTTGHAIPVDHTGQAPHLGTVFLAEPTGTTHPCFMIRARWNEALDYEQPTCGGSTTTGRQEHQGVVRPWLDY